MRPDPEPLKKFEAGDLAIRFRLEHIQLFSGRHYADTRPIVRGLQVVQVLCQDGDRVRWTNFSKKRASAPADQPYIGTSDRRELISLAWFEQLAGVAASSAVPITAGPLVEDPAAAPASFSE